MDRLLLRLRQQERQQEPAEKDKEADRRRGVGDALGSSPPGAKPETRLVIAANEVPIMRPPMLAAKLSPVPRRCTG